MRQSGISFPSTWCADPRRTASGSSSERHDLAVVCLVDASDTAARQAAGSSGRGGCACWVVRLRSRVERFNPRGVSFVILQGSSWIVVGLAVASATSRCCSSGALRLVQRLARPGRGRCFGARHRLWRDPGDVRAPRHDGGPGRTRAQCPVAAVHVHRRTLDRHAAVRFGSRRERPALAGQVGTRGAAPRPSPSAWRGRAATSPRSRTSSRRGTIEGVGHADARRALCRTTAARFVDARFELDDPDVDKLFEEHSWSWTDNPFVGTPRAGRAEGAADADLELGQQGSARRRARIEHRDLRHARVALEARSAVPDHRLGRLDGQMGRHRRHARPLGCRRLRGADAAVRHRRRPTASCSSATPASAPPTRAPASASRTSRGCAAISDDHRRAAARRARPPAARRRKRPSRSPSRSASIQLQRASGPIRGI